MTEHRTPYQAGDGPEELGDRLSCGHPDFGYEHCVLCSFPHQRVDKLECGHPRACVRVDKVGRGTFQMVCAWCESLEVARWQERRRCHDLAMEIAASLRNCDIATEASLAAERVAREIMDEGSQDG